MTERKRNDVEARKKKNLSDQNCKKKINLENNMEEEAVSFCMG